MTELQKNFFIKSHGLGNDYIVLSEKHIDFKMTVDQIKLICDSNKGIGSDGILLHVDSDRADFGLRIFNPDGSEAEKSGNGLRIFSKYLYDTGQADKHFTIDTKGGIVKSEILEQKQGRAVNVEVSMGQATFVSRDIPSNFAADEAIDQRLMVEETVFRASCASMGNPHCVILRDELDVEEIMEFGPRIEGHFMFPNRTNVQFVKVLSSRKISMLIWERGAGYTQASGSSSCAAVAVLKKKGMVDGKVSVKMPGGKLKVEVDDDYNVTMTGEVKEICRGILSLDFVEELMSHN